MYCAVLTQSIFGRVYPPEDLRCFGACFTQSSFSLSRRCCLRKYGKYATQGGMRRKQKIEVGRGEERRRGDTKDRPRELNSGYPHDEAKVTRPLLCPNITVFISIRPTESLKRARERGNAPPELSRDRAGAQTFRSPALPESLPNFPAIPTLLLSFFSLSLLSFCSLSKRILFLFIKRPKEYETHCHYL